MSARLPAQKSVRWCWCWHHVAVNRSGFDGKMTLFIDGILNTNMFGPTGRRTAPPFLRLGSLQTSVGGTFFNGALDDVKLYNGLLAADTLRVVNLQPGGLIEHGGHGPVLGC